jgi:hypothetical protein
MRKTPRHQKPIILAAIALFAVSTGAALAEHSDRSLHGLSRSREMPVDEFKKKIDALGYDLRSFEIDDGASRPASSTAKAGFR